MIKKISLLIIATIFILSCDGLLWNGQPSDFGDDLIISIQNPFYQEADNFESRALALQGKYLYIELARVDDEEMYYSDNGIAKSGNGTWVETPWGGHAIVSFPLDLSSITVVESTFKDVPKNKALSARVLLDVSQSAVESSLDGGPDPVCQTFDSNGSNPLGPSWVTISINNLIDGLIILPIRPKDLIDVAVADLGNPWNELNGMSYMDDYLYGTYQVSKASSINQTTFTAINPVVTDLRDRAYFCTTFNDDTSIAIPWVSVSMYDLYGSLIPSNGNSTIHVVNLPDNTEPGFFLGSTLLLDPQFLEMAWGTSYGLLYYNNSSVSNGYVDWVLPTGISDTDLDFRILEMVSNSLNSIDLQTVDQIFSQQIEHDSGWISGAGNTYDSSFEIGMTTGQFVIILAKPAGASTDDTFIFAKNANGV